MIATVLRRLALGAGLLLAAGASPALAQYTSNYTWDANRRLVMEIAPDPDGVGLLLRPTVKHVYDADGQEIETHKGTSTSATGAGFTAFEIVTVTYDATGKKVKEVARDTATTPVISRVTQFSYDGLGRLTCTAVRMNPATYASLPADACTLGAAGAHGPDRITRQTYDLAGQNLTIVQAFGTADARTYATYTYTANGQQATIRDARGNLTTQTWDGFDRLAGFYFPSTTVGANVSSTTDYETYGYDAAGNRTSVRRRDGQVITNVYDNLKRQTVKDLPGGPAADVHTTYDLTDRVLSAWFAGTSGNGIVMAYDKAGRLTSEATFGRTMTYGYDNAGNRIKATWPDTAFWADYDYDAANRLTAVREKNATTGAGVLATFAYDQQGRRTNLNRGNTATTSYGYDTASRLISLAQTPTSTGFIQTWGFTYSPASQLLSRSDTSLAYKWAPSAAATTATAYDGLNRDAAMAAVGGGYDARGNLTHDGERAFTYDIENRLTSVAGAGSDLTLGYDPQGRLTSTIAVSGVTNFLYDGPRLVAEYNGSGVMLRRYVHGAGTDEPLVWYEGAGTTDRRWLHQDRQGSVVAWSNGSGAVTAGQVYAYGPWGEPTGWTGSRFRYTGQIMLPEARLYHYKARVYDPVAGRFLQTDPIGYKDDLNLYAYVGGDPVNKTDPTGTKGDKREAASKITGSRIAQPGSNQSSSETIGSVVDGVDTAIQANRGSSEALRRASGRTNVVATTALTAAEGVGDLISGEKPKDVVVVTTIAQVILVPAGAIPAGGIGAAWGTSGGPPGMAVGGALGGSWGAERGRVAGRGVGDLYEYTSRGLMQFVKEAGQVWKENTDAMKNPGYAFPGSNPGYGR